MDKVPIPGVGEEASASGAGPGSALQGTALPPEDEPSATELKRFGTFLVIQGLFLVGSPFAGGFHYSIWSMLDTALFVLSIGICAMGFVLETKSGNSTGSEINRSNRREERSTSCPGSTPAGTRQTAVWGLGVGGWGLESRSPAPSPRSLAPSSPLSTPM